MHKGGLSPEGMKNGVQFLNRPVLGGKVNFPLTLAPMVGLSHVALRALVRRYMPEGAETIWPTEMLSSWRLVKEDVGQSAETLRQIDEGLLVPQILGNEEEPIRTSVHKLQEWGAAGIDINMGCPVSKALKHNYGVALMGDAEYASEVVRMTVRHAQVPVSVKLRAGLHRDEPFLLRFVRGLQDAGAAYVTLHPRLGAMKRRGAADWAQIGRVREHVEIPVIGNGDVQCVEDVLALHQVSGCDMVMVGRALAARPWMMWQMGERLGFAAPAAFCGQRAPSTPEEEGAAYGQASRFLLQQLAAHFAFADGQKRFRFHVRMTCGWLEFGHHFFALVTRAHSYEELHACVEEFFSGPQRMTKKTALLE